MDIYKEKYEQALAYAKAIIKDYKERHLDDILQRTKEDFSSVFPELKEESKDEKIRKALIKYFTLSDDHADMKACGAPYREIVAWLEKQSQQEPAEWSREDEQNLNVVLSFIDDEYLRRWLKDAIHVRYDKPTEWSRDDEQFLLICKNALAKYQVSDKWDAAIISRWLENKLKSAATQPKNGWSKEDENMIFNICGMLHSHHNVSSEEYSKYYYWLESLRPQKRWKPSPGQLECLGYVIDKAEKDYSPLKNNRIYLTLKELRRQLKEL